MTDLGKALEYRTRKLSNDAMMAKMGEVNTLMQGKMDEVNVLMGEKMGEVNSRITELSTQAEASNTNLDNKLNNSNTRIETLETFKTNYNNGNKSGSTHYIKGDLQVNEGTHFVGDITGEGSLDFEGAVKYKGNVLATENFVLANAAGGAAGNVDATLTYRFEATDGQKRFYFNFIGSSVAVYLGGLKLDTTDYVLFNSLEKTENDLTVSGSNITVNYNVEEIISITLDDVDYDISSCTISDNVITLGEDNDGKTADVKYKNKTLVELGEGASDGEIFHGVAFGGADFYSKTQADAKYETLVHAAELYATKDELGNAVRRSACMGYFDELTSDRVDSNVTLPLTITMNTPDITVNNDDDSITVSTGGMYYISWQTEITSESEFDTNDWVQTGNLFINDEAKTEYHTYSLTEKYHSFSFNKVVALAAGDVLTFKCHDNENKIVYSGSDKGSSILVMKIG